MVIIDLTLPQNGIDGMTLIQKIRQHPLTGKHLCVALNGYHSTQTRWEAIIARFDAYFPKPIVDNTSFARELRRILFDA
jgi:CheY-like chemotaxis protein